MTPEQTTIEPLRAVVMRDAVLQDRLSAAEDEDAFIAAVRDVAAGRGLPFDEAGLRTLLRPDPLGVRRPPTEAWRSGRAGAPARPGRGRLPTH